MKIETIEKIFDFLDANEGKKLPEEWVKLIKTAKIIKELENHPDDTQYMYNGDLNLGGTNIKKLPNDLYVDGSLSLYGCEQLTKLPDNLYVDGSLSLYDCKQLTELPDKLYVRDSLNIRETNIQDIPNNLDVGWILYIRNTPLAKKYTYNEEIRKIIRLRGGTIGGDIDRS
jgi:hypothetical protein